MYWPSMPVCKATSHPAKILPMKSSFFSKRVLLLQRVQKDKKELYLVTAISLLREEEGVHVANPYFGTTIEKV